MTTDEAFAITEALAGYWPTPALEEAEVKALVVELTGPLRITPQEAATVIKLEAGTGREWRPKPGQIVALVQHHRRQEALRRPRPALSSAPYCTKSENLAHIAHVQELLTTGKARA